MRGVIVGLGVVFWSLLTVAASGQAASPPAPAAAGAGQAPATAVQIPSATPAAGTAPVVTAPAGATPTPPPPLTSTDCGKPFPPATPPEGNETTIVEVNAQTAWRPRGDAVEFTLQGPGVSTGNVEVVVCYRWKTVHGKSRTVGNDWRIAPDLRPIQQSNATAVSFASTVPDDLPGADNWLRRYQDKTLGETTTALGLIPVADMRIVARQKGSAKIFLDVVRPVGISNRGLALFAALASILISWGVLLTFAERRGVPGRNPLLRLITTDTGYASLSQAQIILWTFVVGASTIYVMVLAGNLVTISSGTLILLGISGVSTVVAKVQSYNDDVAQAQPAAASPPPVSPPPVSPPPVSPPPASPPPPAPPPAAASPPPVTAPAHHAHMPQWSDLVVMPDNPREIDVTRVQMLFFTVIMALFVTMRVLSGGVIPEIPEGFLTLMGISNGVYLTSKFIPNSAR